MERSRRNAAMELMRVLAMLMIIGHHLVYYSGLISIGPGLNRHFARLINVGGKLGVNLFVMIGAWFMSGKEYRAERTARIWLQTFSTGCLALLVCVLVWGADSVGNMRHAVFQAIFPVGQSGCWFAAAYIVLSLMMPFLNVLLRLVSRKGLDMLLLVLTAAMSVIPTVFIGKTTFFSPIFWFVYLYLLTGRLRKWPVGWIGKGKWIFFLAGTGLVFASTVVFEALKEEVPLLANNVNYYANRLETLPVLMASVGLFMIFAEMKPFESRAVELAGSSCFGIYLIHDNPLLRRHLWNELIRAGARAQSPFLIPYALLAVAAIFAGSMAMEIIRSRTVGQLEGLMLKGLGRPLSRLDRMMNEELLEGGKGRNREEIEE